MSGTVNSFLQQDATANGPGTTQLVGSSSSVTLVEITESAGGTATVTLLGSFDGTQASNLFPYAVGFQRLDATASPARSVSAISVTANSKHVYQILDPYAQLMASLSSVAGGASVTVRLVVIP